MSVSPLQVTARTLEARVHEAAQSSDNVVFVPPRDKRSMGGMMQYKQALSSLCEGKIQGKPLRNQHGHWEFFIARFAANNWYVLKAAAVVDGPRVTKLYAIFDDEV